MRNKALNLLIFLALALALAVSLALGGCDEAVPTASGSVPMKCVWGFTSVSIILGVGLVLAALRFVLKTTEAQRVTALALTLMVAAAALIPSPFAVGLCSWEATTLCCADLAGAGASSEELAWCAFTMDCHISALTTWIAAALVFLCMSIQVIATRLRHPFSKQTDERPRLL